MTNFVPKTNKTGGLGTSSKMWKEVNHVTASFDTTSLVDEGSVLTVKDGSFAAGTVDASGHNGSNAGLKLGGTLVTATASQINVLGSATSDGEFLVATGAGALAYESGATVRTSLGLGTGDSPSFTSLTLSAQATDLAMNNRKITGLAAPAADGDAANKSYVDGVAQGLDVKGSVRVATDGGDITIATALNIGDSIDGVTLADGDRVLVKDQTTASENGIYIAGASPARSDDMAAASQAAGVFVFVEEGTTNADAGFVCTTNDSADTVGTHSLTFSQFSGAGSVTAGDGLNKSGNTLSVKVDDLTLEINSDTLRVKAEGITNASLNASVITGQQEMTGDVVDTDELLISDNGALKKVDFSVVRDAVFNDISGDATVASGGALTIGSAAIETAMVNKNVITGQTAKNSVADGDLILIADAGDNSSLKKMTKATFVAGLGVASAINDLSDVTITGAANTEYLRYNGTSWVDSALTIVDDTTPQLGGALDVNGKDIVSVSNGNITLTPNGSGVVRIDGSNGIDLQSGEISVKTNTGSPSNIKLYCESLAIPHYTQIQSAAHGTYTGNVTLTLPVSTGTLVGTGDSGTVTNTMLAGSITNAKLTNSTITVTAGDGLSGGGSVALGATTSLALDLNELTSAVVDVAADSIVIVDANDSNASKKESVADLVAGIAGTGLSPSSGQLSIDGTVTTLAGSQTLTNKTLTSAVLNADVSGTAILDEDNMTSDSATKLATQQSIKAYVDSQVAGGGLNIDGYNAHGSSTIHQTQDHFVFSSNGTETKLTFSNLEDAIFGNVSSDATIAAAGALTIAADAVTYTKMQNVSATNKLLGRSSAGAGVVEEIACTAAGRALLDDADASAQRTTLGLGTGDSPAFTSLSLSGQAGALAMNSQKITGLSDPASAQDAATKSYVDGVAQGLSAKDSVRAATTEPETLATDFANGQAIDGVTLATGDRILIKNQATGAENGVYTVNASGAPTRAADFDANAEVAKGAFIFVEEGTLNADAGFVLTTDGAITLETTALAFTQFSGAGDITAGDALTKSGNTLNVAVNSSGGLEINNDELRVKATGITSAMLAGSIANSKLNTISTANKVALTALDLDGGTDIGADLVDADLIVVDDGAGGTNRKSALSRIKKYIFSSVSGDASATDSGGFTVASSGVAADDITAGNSSIDISTNSGNLIINNSGNGGFTLKHTNTASTSIDVLNFNRGQNGLAEFYAPIQTCVTQTGTNILGGSNTEIAGHLYPGSNNNRTLGKAANTWSDLYLGDSSYIYFGDDQEITMQHDPDDGLILKMVGSTTYDPSFVLTSDSAGTTGPRLVLRHDSASPANNDRVGLIDFAGDDSVGSFTSYGQIAGFSSAVSSGSEVGKIVITPYPANLNVKGLSVEGIANESTKVKVDIDTHNGSDSGLHLGGTLITATAAELNLLDGGTAVGNSITVDDADGFVINDGGTMKTIPATDLKTYVGSSDLTSISSNVVPSAADTYNLGSAAHEWSNLYLGDSSKIYFGNDQDVFLEHQADVGLTLDMGVTESNDEPTLKLVSGGASATRGPSLNLFFDKTAPADTSTLGQVVFAGRDDGGGLTYYGNIGCKPTSDTNGSEVGGIFLTPMPASGHPNNAGLNIVGVAGQTQKAIVDVNAHNGSDSGLKLGGTLVTSIASELNALDVSAQSPSDNEVLTYTAASGLHWAAAAGGGGGSQLPPEVKTVSSAATLSLTPSNASTYNAIEVIYTTTGSSAYTVTLPTAASIEGKKIHVKRLATANITVDGDGSETIDGSATFVLTSQYSSVTLISDGTNWIII